jgi:hypothetical protein
MGVFVPLLSVSEDTAAEVTFVVTLLPDAEFPETEFLDRVTFAPSSSDTMCTLAGAGLTRS